MRRLPVPLLLTSSWVQRLANAFGSPNVLYANHLCGWHKSGVRSIPTARAPATGLQARALRAPLGLQSPGFSAS